jgi:hypothetical protein
MRRRPIDFGISWRVVGGDAFDRGVLKRAMMEVSDQREES